MTKPYNGLPPFIATSDTSEAAALSVDASASSMRARCPDWHLHITPKTIKALVKYLREMAV